MHKSSGPDIWVTHFFPVFAVPLLLVLSSGSLFGQSLKGVTEETCLRGDCMSGEGTLELTTKFGKGRYTGGFLKESLKAMAALRCRSPGPKRKFTWELGARSAGRARYALEWQRQPIYRPVAGQQAQWHWVLFFNLSEWRENQHSEYWLKENTENYTGEFVNDHYQGQGTYRWVNGHRYEGAFLLATSMAWHFLLCENGYRTTTAMELRGFCQMMLSLSAARCP